MPFAKTNKPRDIIAAERKNYALQLRSAGLSYREVAIEILAKFGDKSPGTYDERYAHRDVKDEMERLKSSSLETASDLRLIELERLDQLQSAIYAKALAGEYKAVDRVLKIMHHRALIMGLYAPSHAKLEVSDWHTEVIDLIKTGRITRAQAEEELGEEVVNELLESGSDTIVEGRYAPEEIE